MTSAATRFVGPLTFESLTHRPVVADVMELDADEQIAHIELAEAADAIVLAPATANLIGELAAGLVGNAVTAIACASRAPVIVAPAMDAGMWSASGPSANVATLREFGTSSSSTSGSASSPPADGIGGWEPPTILEAVREPIRPLRRPRGAATSVVSAGGPESRDRWLHLQPVVGEMGTAIAESARDRGHRSR